MLISLPSAGIASVHRQMRSWKSAFARIVKADLRVARYVARKGWGEICADRATEAEASGDNVITRREWFVIWLDTGTLGRRDRFIDERSGA